MVPHLCFGQGGVANVTYRCAVYTQRAGVNLIGNFFKGRARYLRAIVSVLRVVDNHYERILWMICREVSAKRCLVLFFGLIALIGISYLRRTCFAGNFV
jgi:hypothetical protein